MCEFCHKHGEGKKWYLQAKNYSEDFLSDLKRRRFIEEFFAAPDSINSNVSKMNVLNKAPEFLQKLIKKRITGNQKPIHFGQVIPIEDIEKIFEFTTSIVRLECICRRNSIGRNQRYCYGISIKPNGGAMVDIISKIDKSFLYGPGNKELEVLEKQEALDIFKDYEKKGLCHTIWTFHTPFIGGLCNCNAKDCHAMQMTVGYNTPVMFKAEYSAEIQKDSCTGCKLCMKVCQFNAIQYDSTNKKSIIKDDSCYGCGICRSVCKKNAIVLKEKIK
jgi:Pyruvate/2-oxoacid:ferredoxin oxidoreductase delta subunit